MLNDFTQLMAIDIPDRPVVRLTVLSILPPLELEVTWTELPVLLMEHAVAALSPELLLDTVPEVSPAELYFANRFMTKVTILVVVLSPCVPTPRRFLAYTVLKIA